MRGHWLFRRVGAEKLPALRWLPSTLSYFWGSHRRNRGFYDALTRQLHSSSGPARSVGALIRQTAYERDLGIAPSRVRCEELLRLAGLGSQNVSERQMFRYVNLLLEGSAAHEPVLQGRFDETLGVAFSHAQLHRLASHSPAVAALLARRDESLSSQSALLAGLHQSQSQWRSEFLTLIRDNERSVCVVGNSPNLRGAGEGTAIDAHPIVVRFNRCSSDWLPEQDAGRKLDVWVRAPGLELVAPPNSELPAWVILSGADLRYQMRNWSRVLPLLRSGVKVLTVPLPTWGRLAAQLQAPPSAGLLIWHWLLEELKRPASVRVLGFQQFGVGTKNRTRARHNWPAEDRVIQQLRSIGLP